MKMAVAICDVCSAFLAVAISILAYSYVSKRRVLNRTLPPGPYFSLLGRMYGRSTSEATAILLGLKKKYGDVCSFRVMGTLCVYLNSHEKIRQYLVNHGEATSGRIDMRSTVSRFGKARGLVMNDGQSWIESRRFVMSALRDFGFGRGGTDQIVQAELQELIKACSAFKDLPFDPRFPLNSATCNVISLVIFNERCGSASDFTALFERIQENVLIMNNVHDQVLMTLFKLSKFLPGVFIRRSLRHINHIREYLEAKVIEHKQTFNGEINDLVDCYLKKLEEITPDQSHLFNDYELYAIIMDLFIAGMETTAATLRWAILLLVRNEDVCKRVHREVDEFLSGRLPSSADRKDLVYTDAVLMEVQRFASVMPLGAIHHRCIEDVTIGPHNIPKDTMVYSNLFAAHRDEAIWPDPFNFNPDNFYDSEKRSIKNAEYLIPFGVGRRTCLGESLAKQELFVYFCGLMQQFEFVLPESEPFPRPDDCVFGNMRIAPPFKIVFRQRNAK